MDKIVVYSADWCSGCVSAKRFLEEKNIPYEEININENPDAKEKIKKLGFKTVPQIWLNEKHIGGYEELEKKYV